MDIYNNMNLQLSAILNLDADLSNQPEDYAMIALHLSNHVFYILQNSNHMLASQGPIVKIEIDD